MRGLIVCAHFSLTKNTFLVQRWCYVYLDNWILAEQWAGQQAAQLAAQFLKLHDLGERSLLEYNSQELKEKA